MRGNGQTNRLGNWAALLGLATLLLAFDQWTKSLVVRSLEVGEAWAPIPALAKIFTFTHVRNTGVSFGQLQGVGWLFMVVNLAVLVAVMIYYPRIPAGEKLLRVSAGLIVAGDLGNVIDRLRTGYQAFQATGELWTALSRAYVIDFFDFKIWPVWNIADMCIVSGVLILAWKLWRAEKEISTQKPAPGEPIP